MRYAWAWALGAAGVGVGIYFLVLRPKRLSGPAVAVPGLPDARRVPEGYIMSALPSAEHVPRMRELGIKAVLSLVDLDPATERALDAAGIRRIYAPMGKTFRDNHARAARSLREFDPEEVLIHCTHGVDRTGNVVAYLLHVRHGWSIPDALYAVVNPSEVDVSGLARALTASGFPDVRTVDSPGVGIYSWKYAFDRSGGMKARNPDYIELITTNIAHMRRDGR